MQRWFVAVLLAVTWGGVAIASEPDQPSYKALTPIPLSDGRWDLVSVDTNQHSVLIARGDSVSNVSLADSTVASIGNISRGHAALPIEGTNLIAVTSGGDNSVRLIDAGTGKQAATIAVGQNPDAAIYDSRSKRLIVMNAKSGTVSVINPFSGHLVKTITVKPALELGAMVGPDLLAINDEDANEIELVDLKRGKALKPIALPGCEGPTGIAFDSADGLLLSACANGQAALVDARSRRLIRLLPIGKGADGALFDPKRRRFLVPCGQSAILSVFAVGKGGAISALSPITTEAGARTAALDPVSGRIYLPAAKFEPATGGGRPALVAGSVHLIVLEPSLER